MAYRFELSEKQKQEYSEALNTCSPFNRGIITIKYFGFSMMLKNYLNKLNIVN